MKVYLEVGAKRVFAGALDWPGWSRSGRDEEAALATLVAYRDRYAAVVADRRLPTTKGLAGLDVVERVKGNATTDFGAPGIVPASDRAAITEAELELWLAILGRCWSAFEAAVRTATGRQLATGPRGGGRSASAIAEHVEGAHAAYARQVGGSDGFDEAVRARWRGELPERGPRGGERWPPRYAIRRAAWHILDHAWEIEDRLSPAGRLSPR